MYRKLPRALRGGVMRLRAEKEEFVFRHPRETKSDYDLRLKRLQFQPFYWESAEFLGGQPFTKDIVFSADTPAELVDVWAKDIDGTGLDLRRLARSSCINSVGYGVGYLWSVYDKAKGRPYVKFIPPDLVLDPYEPGRPVRVRFFDTEEDKNNKWLRVEVEQMWVFYDGEATAGGDDRFARWEVYEHKERLNPESEWKSAPEDELGGNFEPLTEIPLTPIYTGNNSPQDQLPWVVIVPQYDLAASNLIWTQKKSDLDWGLYLANVPQRCVAGASADEVKQNTTVSPSAIWSTMSPQGKYYYLQHDGACFEIAQRDLGELERRMEVMGSMPNVSQADIYAVSKTATGEVREMKRSVTTAQAWAYGWQDSWETALRKCTRYARLNDSFTLEFNTEFGPQSFDRIAAAQIVQQDYINGDLAPELYYPIIKSLGVYPDTFDADQAAALAKASREATMQRISRIPPPQPQEQVPQP